MIWVIAGTQDGRELAAELKRHSGEKVIVTVISQYGKLLAAPGVDQVLVGRLTQDQMEELIGTYQIDCVVDASHPYAAIVSQMAQAAAKVTSIRYLRYERPEVPLPDYARLYHAKDEYEAAELAASLGKRIYLTTGSKTLPVFMQSKALSGKEIWARVLPTPEVVAQCKDLGLTPKYIVAIQGPFSLAMNRAMFTDTQADVIVMKNSGLVGGTDTKLTAAMETGTAIVVIDRPINRSEYPVLTSVEDVIKAWEEL